SVHERYSISVALGSAIGGCANAAMVEKEAADRKAKAEASWDAAKPNWTPFWTPARHRPVSSYDTEVAGAWERQRLTSWISELKKDIARAGQCHSELREKAKAAMDKSWRRLGRPGSPNADAVALAAYLQALGLNIDAAGATRRPGDRM